MTVVRWFTANRVFLHLVENKIGVSVFQWSFAKSCMPSATLRLMAFVVPVKPFMCHTNSYRVRVWIKVWLTPLSYEYNFTILPGPVCWSALLPLHWWHLHLLTIPGIVCHSVFLSTGITKKLMEKSLFMCSRSDINAVMEIFVCYPLIYACVTEWAPTIRVGQQWKYKFHVTIVMRIRSGIV